jgi:hypothetical protein
MPVAVGSALLKSAVEGVVLTLEALLSSSLERGVDVSSVEDRVWRVVEGGVDGDGVDRESSCLRTGPKAVVVEN